MHHMDDAPCPNCGFRRTRYLMSTNLDPEAPGLAGLWRGEGDPMMQLIAKAGTVIISVLILAELFHLIAS